MGLVWSGDNGSWSRDHDDAIWPAAAITFAGCWLWSAAFWTQPQIGRDWQGVDLHMGKYLGRNPTLSYYRDLLATIGQTHPRDRTIVLPECVLGFWTPTVANLWQTNAAGGNMTVIGGAAAVTETGYDNVLVQISGQRVRPGYIIDRCSETSLTLLPFGEGGWDGLAGFVDHGSTQGIRAACRA